MTARDPYPGKWPCVCGSWIASPHLVDMKCPMCGVPLVYACTLREIARLEELLSDATTSLIHVGNTARIEHLPTVAGLADESRAKLAELFDVVRALRDRARVVADGKRAA